MSKSIQVPTDPAERKKLKAMLSEMTHCMQRIDSEREAKKEIAAEAAEKFDIPKKVVNKLATTMYKRNYADLAAENADFELLYESLVEGKVVDIKEAS